MIKIGALWRCEKENSKVKFTGKVDLPTPLILTPGLSILLFKNKSEHEKSPVLDVFIADSGQKQNGNKSADLGEEF
jgi:hypothetical protein